MLPDSGCRKPAISRRSVVLPQPEGPRTVVKEPCGTCRVTSSTARVAARPGPVDGNDRVTPVMVSELMRGPCGVVQGSGAEEKNVVGCSCWHAFPAQALLAHEQDRGRDRDQHEQQGVG